MSTLVFSLLSAEAELTTFLVSRNLSPTKIAEGGICSDT
jgi:hypothetical protein